MLTIAPWKALIVMLVAAANLLPQTAARLPTTLFIATTGSKTSLGAFQKLAITRGISGGIKMSAEEAFIKSKITQPCVVFSKTYCPFCDSAKRTLTKEGAKFDVVELDILSNGDAIQKTLAQMTGRRTVPNVFVGGKTIGGGDDTKALSASGQLAKILKEAGALK